MPAAARGLSDLWRLFLVLAVTVLSLEWWFWLRALPRRRVRRPDAYLLRAERTS